MRRNQLPAGALDPTGRYFNPRFCCNFNGLMDATSGWGLAFMLDNRPRAYGRSAGTALWGGVFNTYFFIDFDAGIAASIFTQHLPFNHEATTSLFERFAALVYADDGASRGSR